MNRTDLTGRYDFYLEFGNNLSPVRTVEGTMPEPYDQGQFFLSAVQTQLGLKLIPVTTQIELLIIDHINRIPTGN